MHWVRPSPCTQLVCAVQCIVTGWSIRSLLSSPLTWLRWQVHDLTAGSNAEQQVGWGPTAWPALPRVPLGCRALQMGVADSACGRACLLSMCARSEPVPIVLRSVRLMVREQTDANASRASSRVCPVCFPRDRMWQVERLRSQAAALRAHGMAAADILLLIPSADGAVARGLIDGLRGSDVIVVVVELPFRESQLKKA